MADLSAAAQRVQRCVWLYAKLRNDGKTDYLAYNARFGASTRSYYRDLGLLNRIGVSFRFERDHGRVLFTGEAL